MSFDGGQSEPLRHWGTLAPRRAARDTRAMRSLSRSRLLVVPVVAVLAAPLGVQAQDAPARQDTADATLAAFTLSGVVRDTFHRPLPAAEVRAARQVAITDSLGRFGFDDLVENPVHLLVRRIGYQPVETSLERRTGVLRVEIAVRLEPAAVQLGTVVVNERRVPTALLGTGYLQRQRVGNGTFFDGEELERMGSTYTAVLGSIPGVDLQFGKFGAIFPLGRAAAGGKCVMDVYLDGSYMSWAREEGINLVLPKQELMAIEVYPRATQIPSTVRPPGGRGGAGSLCGAILLWSRPFEPRNETENPD